MIGVLAVVAAYLIGGIPFGYVFVRLTTGRDVRNLGSGNIGATNVLRTTGRALAIVVLLLDILKGWVAVWLAARLTDDSTIWTSVAAVAVMLGHAYPIFLNFRGGKAVASFIGAFLYLAPAPLLAVLLIFIAVVSYTRYISLGSILGAGLFPFAVWMILRPPAPLLLAAVFASVFIIVRHRENLNRLRAGNENVFRFAKPK